MFEVQFQRTNLGSEGLRFGFLKVGEVRGSVRIYRFIPSLPQNDSGIFSGKTLTLVRSPMRKCVLCSNFSVGRHPYRSSCELGQAAAQRIFIYLIWTFEHSERHQKWFIPCGAIFFAPEEVVTYSIVMSIIKAAHHSGLYSHKKCCKTLRNFQGIGITYLSLACLPASICSLF